MKENNKGSMIILTIIGIATLLVAVIGATFAYFSASAQVTGNENLTGTTAEAVGLSVAVAKVNPTAEALGDKLERLVPLNSTADMASALTAGCLDDNGYTACQVYSVTITSDATETVIATPTVTLAASDFTNLRWQLLDGTSATDFALNSAFDSVENSTGKALGNVELSAAAGQTKTLYFVVWLENTTDADQNEEAGKTYTGTVSVNAVDALGQPVGGNLSATFSA